MKGIILAAGRGSRLKSLTNDQPKCRVKLHGKELIKWQIDSLSDAGINSLAIVRGYMAQSFKFKMKYFENSRWNKTNMVVSLMTASEWLKEDNFQLYEELQKNNIFVHVMRCVRYHGHDHDIALVLFEIQFAKSLR